MTAAAALPAGDPLDLDAIAERWRQAARADLDAMAWGDVASTLIGSDIPKLIARVRQLEGGDVATSDLDETDRLLAASTPAPWLGPGPDEATSAFKRYGAIVYPHGRTADDDETTTMYGGEVICESVGSANGRLISHARSALPRYVRELRVLRRQVKDYRAMIEDAIGGALEVAPADVREAAISTSGPARLCVCRHERRAHRARRENGGPWTIPCTVPGCGCGEFT